MQAAGLKESQELQPKEGQVSTYVSPFRASVGVRIKQGEAEMASWLLFMDPEKEANQSWGHPLPISSRLDMT